MGFTTIIMEIVILESGEKTIKTEKVFMFIQMEIIIMGVGKMEKWMEKMEHSFSRRPIVFIKENGKKGYFLKENIALVAQ